MTADFERVFIVCELARFTKIQNVWFCTVSEFTFSDAIHDKPIFQTSRSDERDIGFSSGMHSP